VNGASSWWWLRSPGDFGYRAAYVSYDGYVLVYGKNVYGLGSRGGRDGGVRPAMWIKID